MLQGDAVERLKPGSGGMRSNWVHSKKNVAKAWIRSAGG